MTILNLAKMWPINKREIDIAAHIVANSYPLQQTVGMLLYGSLITINPSALYLS